MNITTDAVLKSLTRTCQAEIHKGYKTEIAALKSKLKTVLKDNMSLKKQLDKKEDRDNDFSVLKDEVEDIIEGLEQELASLNLKRSFQDTINELNSAKKRIEKLI